MMFIRITFILCFLLLSAVCQGDMYDDFIYLSTAPGWANEKGGTTGGGKTPPVLVTSLEEFEKAVRSLEPKTIILNGVIGTGLSTKIMVCSNKTILGFEGALVKGSLYLKDANNIIIRNLKIEGPGAVDVDGPDCITVDHSTHVWLDHLDIYDGQDGNVDIVNGSDYITVSWCKFHYTSASVNHKLSTLIGNSDAKTSDRGTLKTTMIYNWWADGVTSRMPRVRYGQVHVVNNLYTSTGNDYCILAGKEADLRIEYNLFKNVKEPINLSQKTFTAVTVLNNRFISVSGNTSGSGEAFTPPYSVSIIPLDVLEEVIKSHAGATISDKLQTHVIQ